MTIADGKVQVYDSGAIPFDEMDCLSKDSSGAGEGNVNSSANKAPVNLTLKHQFYENEASNENNETDAPLYASFNTLDISSISILTRKNITNFNTATFQETSKIPLPTEKFIKPNLERGEIKNNPHDTNQIYQCGGKNLNIFDSRDPSISLNISSKYRIRSFDINPNRPEWGQTYRFLRFRPEDRVLKFGAGVPRV